MGFSVSGSFAILVLAGLIVLGNAYPAMSNASDRVDEAKDEMATIDLKQENTDIDITDSSYNASGSEQVTLTINNTGTTALTVNDTTILIDNEYQSQAQTVTTDVEGDTATDLWLPGERLNVTTDPTVSSPSFARVVAEYDIADRRGL